MKNQELIDRYVYAVVKHMPRKQAEDIDKELHGLIEDMLAERCGERPAEQKDVLVILTELGTPQELASQYGQDKDSCLIGQPYYSQYKLVVKWVLFAVVIGLTIAMAVGLILKSLDGSLTGLSAAGQAAQWLGSLFASSLGVIGGLTVVYAFLQKKGIRLEETPGFSTNLLELPPVPEKKEKVSRCDAIVDIVLSILFLCVFLLFPNIIMGVFQRSDGVKGVPFFNEAVIREIWYIIMGIAVCGVAKGVFELMEGRYTMRLAVVKGICGLADIVLCLLFVTREGIINEGFLENTAVTFQGKDAWMGTLFFPRLLMLLFILCVFANILEFGTALYKALRYRRNE